MVNKEVKTSFGFMDNILQKVAGLSNGQGLDYVTVNDFFGADGNT